MKTVLEIISKFACSLENSICKANRPQDVVVCRTHMKTSVLDHAKFFDLRKRPHGDSFLLLLLRSVAWIEHHVNWEYMSGSRIWQHSHDASGQFPHVPQF
mmetsp:Transcript_3280/g.5102  ORF Transcript_3280/g.5102 Transcript_3280/m.5102 type:complete len:100 (-) Transcript_3280:836-1135(-)